MPATPLIVCSMVVFSVKAAGGELGPVDVGFGAGAAAALSTSDLILVSISSLTHSCPLS
jgi:hypothetical protein